MLLGSAAFRLFALSEQSICICRDICSITDIDSTSAINKVLQDWQWFYHDSVSTAKAKHELLKWKIKLQEKKHKVDRSSENRHWAFWLRRKSKTPVALVSSGQEKQTSSWSECKGKIFPDTLVSPYTFFCSLVNAVCKVSQSQFTARRLFLAAAAVINL